MEEQAGDAMSGLLIALGVLGVPLLIATAIGFARNGPVRWVKIATALLLVLFLTARGLASGWAAAISTLAVIGGLTALALGFALSSWRHPVHRILSAAAAEDCPRHARRALDHYSEELESLGFRWYADRRTAWQLQGQDRVTFIRFFVHSSEPIWLEIHALDEPKVVARMALSDKGCGRAVVTCDRQADQEFFEDEHTVLERVPSGSTCRALLDAHRKLAMTSSEGTIRSIDDPTEAHCELYARWVARMLETAQVRKIDDFTIALVPTSIPRMILRSASAWFH